MMWCEFNKAEPGSITHKPESLSAGVPLAWMQTSQEKNQGVCLVAKEKKEKKRLFKNKSMCSECEIHNAWHLKYFSRLPHDCERKKELYWEQELILVAFPGIKSCSLALSLCHMGT